MTKLFELLWGIRRKEKEILKAYILILLKKIFYCGSELMAVLCRNFKGDIFIHLLKTLLLFYLKRQFCCGQVGHWLECCLACTRKGGGFDLFDFRSGHRRTEVVSPVGACRRGGY